MKLAAFFLLALVSVVLHGHAADTITASGLPSDVSESRKRRDFCDHFRGEDPYNKERRKFLEEKLKKVLRLN